MQPIDPSAPFVLLDDARTVGAAPARLYRDPVDTVVVTRAAEVPRALRALRVATGAGLHVAGYLTYEAGLALEPRLAVRCREDRTPLLWFGLFRDCETIAPEAVTALLPNPRSARLSAPRPRIDREAYAALFDRVQALIAAGDIYQANLTLRADVALLGEPLAAYAALRDRACAGYGAVVHTGERWLLSCSPELFVALHEGKATARPMKGTAPAATDPAALAADPKQRAENLMIVDLLRNDLSRVADPGSVDVPELFRVDSYPTLHQMTSTVTARLAEGRDAIDLIDALYPCGSITGAPKIRAMEVIADIEGEPRGAYCGAIGRIEPDGSAAFNVAIRTLELTTGESTAMLGLGGGIVADSHVDEEWAEAIAKGAFVTAGQHPVDLIETMAFDPMEGLLRLEAHLARMKASAEALGFAFNRHDTRNDLQAATFRLRAPARIRLRLAPSGRTAIETAPMPPLPPAPAPVAIMRLPVPSSDWRLRHKSSDRGFYDAARVAGGAFETIFCDSAGQLTEGSFTNIFVERDGLLLTPPLERGLLAGVLRAELLERGSAIEQDLLPDDLANGFLIGNALRGLMPARLVAAVQQSR